LGFALDDYRTKQCILETNKGFTMDCVARILVLTILSCFLFVENGVVHAAEVHWTRSPEVAAKQASDSGRMIIVSVGAKWCHFCKKMDRDTWNDNDVANAIAAEYVPLKLSDEEHRELIKAMGIQGFPATLIFTPDRRLVARLDGYVGPDKMLDAMTQIRSALATANNSANLGSGDNR